MAQTILKTQLKSINTKCGKSEQQIDILFNQRGKWNMNLITAEQIQLLLKNGYQIHTKATSMQSGSHQWTYNVKKDEIYCFGSGQNWQDQSSECSLSLINASNRIEELLKSHKSLIDRANEYYY